MQQELQTTLEPQIAALVGDLIERRHVPIATYRLQFHPDFTFADAWAMVDYLHTIGIGDAYASPIFTARAGSMHGYDVCDYGQINPALGGEEGFVTFSDALRERGMGLVLDVVPNHMGIGNDNPWWMDVLENGESSPYARFFDIDWHPVKAELDGKVLLPVLGDQYGVVLENGELQLRFDTGAFSLRYYDSRFPIEPSTYRNILEVAHEPLRNALGEDNPDFLEYESILTATSYLPPRTEEDPDKLSERMREKEVIKRRLSALTERNKTVRQALDAAITTLNGTPGDPHSFDQLHTLIDAQPYRLAFWRVAAEEINYRRFFDINDLAAVREEVPEMFAAAHQLVLQLLADGRVSGLRVDHPDGLFDPPAYFRNLQEQFVRVHLPTEITETVEAPEPAEAADEAITNAITAWATHYQAQSARQDNPWPLYVVAEKILSEREPLPYDWAVDGTTGYDFLNAANGIFVDPANERTFDHIYRRFIAPDDPHSVPSFDEQVYRAKQEIMDSSLASEIASLSYQLERIDEKNRRYRDFTLRGLTGALSAVIASLSIYRTYLTETGEVSERDRRYVQEAVRAARRRHPRIARSLFRFIEDTLLLRNLHEFQEEDRADVLRVVMRIQQLTGPVMAKSMEDTAFYRYHRLVSLNEVGGHPDQFGISVAAFHRENADRHRNWPHTMLASSTHDTKRSEDVRARINVLSELPQDWDAALQRWSELNARHKQDVDGELMPDRNDEYLLYQTLVGTWPLATDHATRATFCDRIVAYMEKATKEAKVHTSWINPNEEYDAALEQFVRAILDGSGENTFIQDIAAFQRPIARYGQINSLAQTLLKLTAPGVPDIYQGTELWDLSLVDPDNRRPVDYSLRQQMLDAIMERRAADTDRAELMHALLDQRDDGRVKLYLIAETLRFRQDHAALFAQGDYQPIDVEGQQASHVCAYARVIGGESLIVVVPRLVASLTGSADRLPIGAEVWGETRLRLPNGVAGGRYRDVLSGHEVIATKGADGLTIDMAAALAHFPVALLERMS